MLAGPLCQVPRGFAGPVNARQFGAAQHVFPAALPGAQSLAGNEDPAAVLVRRLAQTGRVEERRAQTTKDAVGNVSFQQTPREILALDNRPIISPQTDGQGRQAWPIPSTKKLARLVVGGAVGYLETRRRFKRVLFRRHGNNERAATSSFAVFLPPRTALAVGLWCPVGDSVNRPSSTTSGRGETTGGRWDPTAARRHCCVRTFEPEWFAARCKQRRPQQRNR